MADNTTPQPGPAGNDAAPQLPDDSKQWADLAAELEEGKGAFEAEAPDAPPEKTEPEPPPEKTEPDRPRPSYEQLEAAERGKTAALKEEREARRRAEESLQNVNKLIDELRTARQSRQPAQPEPEPPKIPDINEDPIGHFQARTAMLEQALEQTYRGSQQTAEHIRAQQAEQQFWNHVRAHEEQFRKTTPMLTLPDGQQASDYDVACDYLKQHRMTELTHIYPDNSAIAEQEARQYGLPSAAHLRAAMLQQDAIGIAQRAFQLGISPAQLYYEAAKTRGYKPGQAAAANGKGKTNGQIEAAKRGQRAALTIGGGEGRKTSNDMTISDLSDLWLEDPDAFDKEWEKMKAAGKL